MMSFLIIVFFAFAGGFDIFIEGKIISYDQNKIELLQKSGAVVVLPRESKKDMKGVRVGEDWLRLPVAPSKFVELNPRVTKSPKK